MWHRTMQVEEEARRKAKIGASGVKQKNRYVIKIGMSNGQDCEMRLGKGYGVAAESITCSEQFRAQP
jgi:hypothetical protein